MQLPLRTFFIDEKDPAAIAKSVQSLVMRLKKSGILSMMFCPPRRLPSLNVKDRHNYSQNLIIEVSVRNFRYRTLFLFLGSDYIHASRVMVGNNMFICTQGPLNSSKESFWAMVIQEKVKLIVMLCKLVEDGKEKCVEYFPRNGGENLRHLMIFPTSIFLTDLEHLTTQLSEKCGVNPSFQVEHIWYENWADHTAPENFKATVELIRLARKKRQNAPVIVHCSAGDLSEECAAPAATTSSFSMEMVLKAIRDQRMHSIQNDMVVTVYSEHLIPSAELNLILSKKTTKG
ncbi:unnamed protein product [Haemonchus placei]|uniref:Tyrosine-protein phosphatase domain-containing protein n=1 Tax=Haemonchus placei TaxID=6290 RepID=A0A0N4WC19_HAEPC|nr:unnamed protein product [Haemonchus placei]